MTRPSALTAAEKEVQELLRKHRAILRQCGRYFRQRVREHIAKSPAGRAALEGPAQDTALTPDMGADRG